MIQSINKGNHQWEKQNLVTQVDKMGQFDTVKCKCGLKAKRVNFEQVQVDGRQKSKAEKCPLYTPKESTNKVIIITRCTAFGRAFENLTPNSEHTLITPPVGRSRDEYWVEGVGEPVRLLKGEFIFK
jgi:hypothetical protein